jgi:hypothetical protein
MPMVLPLGLPGLNGKVVEHKGASSSDKRTAGMELSFGKSWPISQISVNSDVSLLKRLAV